jgi:capsular exopolysaccharide synthesis family protein
MSRIHDALKKAEQERNVSRSAAAVGAVEVVPPAAGHADAVSPAAAEKQVTGPRTAHLPAPLTGEDLQARVRVSPWNPDAKRIVSCHTNESTVGTEEFRSLRSKLYQSRDAGPLRKVLVTSALPQEGKTFIAANLAYAIVRQRERRALLIDGDLRWSRLHSFLGTNLSPGMTEYLRGDADELSIIQRGPLENLYFIPGGRSASNAAELIQNGRFKVLMEHLAPLFDWIIVDSPPAIAMSDASLMAEFCDGVLMVVATGKTPFDVAQKTREQFRKPRLLGVVLNRVEPQSTGSHYYYGYYEGAGNAKKAKR